jgi:hypothetical protein
LVGDGLVVESNGQTAAIAKGGTAFTFAGKIAKGTAYKVTVKSQPTQLSQTCSVTKGEGTLDADVNNVAIACTTNTYSVSANVLGLTGAGLVLQNNAGDDLAVPGPSPVSPAFGTKIPSGGAYAVTVKTQPTGQFCSVTGGTGNVVAGDVAVVVNCANAYTIGGTVTGLAGTGLVLQNNAGADLAVNGSTFTFPKGELTGAAYAVTVKTQPSAPAQLCTVAAGTGTVAAANVTNVAVTCVTQYRVQVKVDGLTGTGVVLQNNGAGDLTVNAAGTVAFVATAATGAPYAVTLKTDSNAAGEKCTLAPFPVPPSGNIAGADVTVRLSCAKSRLVFASSVNYVGGNIDGLNGADSKCQALAAAAGKAGTFAAWLSDDTGSPSVRFVQSPVPYKRADDVTVAANFAALAGLSAHIDRTENNTALQSNGTLTSTLGGPGSAFGLGVFTNTSATGTRLGASHCSNWTSTAGGISTWGVANQNLGTDRWTVGPSGGSCAWSGPIYCFQQ